jgi:hypothetical protein
MQIESQFRCSCVEYGACYGVVIAYRSALAKEPFGADINKHDRLIPLSCALIRRAARLSAAKIDAVFFIHSTNP